MISQEDKINQAASWLASAELALAFSGAGLSVPSGIPDFRSPGGLWERFDPYDYAHIDSFARDPERVWTMLREMNATIFPAKPNAGHIAIAELERLGFLKAVITQNIDELHQQAGSGEVIEFHGSARRFVCRRGHGRHTENEILSGSLGDPPRCPSCKNPLKPDIVFFGETIPEAALARSFELADRADLMIVVGTSAQVAPASALPLRVARQGGRLIEINLTPTHLAKEYGALPLSGDCAEILPRLLAAVRRLETEARS